MRKGVNVPDCGFFTICSQRIYYNRYLDEDQKGYYRIRGTGSSAGFARGARRAPIERSIENVL